MIIVADKAFILSDKLMRL